MKCIILNAISCIMVIFIFCLNSCMPSDAHLALYLIYFLLFAKESISVVSYEF